MCCKKDYCNILNFSGHGFRYSVNLVGGGGGGWGGVFSCNLYPLSFIAFHNFSLLMFCMKIQSFKVNLCSWFFSEGQVVHQSRIHFKKKEVTLQNIFVETKQDFHSKIICTKLSFLNYCLLSSVLMKFVSDSCVLSKQTKFFFLFRNCYFAPSQPNLGHCQV